MSQLIIAIGRESGSGGLEIARTLADRFGLPLYDKSILQSAAEDRGVDPKSLEQYDERPRSPLFYRSIKGFSSAPEDGVAQMQFDLLRRHAAAGESFVVLGRCGEQVLKNNPNCISIFICGNPQFKLGRIMETLNLDTEQAIEEIKSVDRSRKNYHNYYCDTKWGDARGYDMTIKSNVLGCEETAEMLVSYIRRFMAQD